MNQSQYNKQLFSFLDDSPTPFHGVANMEDFFLGHNFTRLKENSHWQLEQGRSYFVTREHGAIIAFTLGSQEVVQQGFRMVAAHTDSPCLQIKPRPDIKTGTYHQLGVEVYGGSLLHPWFDRNLSLAGRVCCRRGDGTLAVLLVNFQRPLLIIPSIAIHLNREANQTNAINKQNHLPPIISQSVERQLPDFSELLLQQTRKEHPAEDVKEVVTFDMFCYEYQPPVYLGVNSELISGARLDNLLSCHAGMVALAEADRTRNSLLFCANHEENGSTSATGAHGSFIDSVLERITPEPETRRISLCNSFLISTDNAHAAHPNFMDRSDPAHEIDLNSGPVIKINANQRYATNSLSGAIYKQICSGVELTAQEFVMRSDMPCGSTVGPITAARLGVRTIDVGAPTLAMHSIREVTGSKDPLMLFSSLIHFLNHDVHRQFGG